MIRRVVLAVLLAAVGAFGGGLVFKALGLEHFWSGVVVSFVVTLPVELWIFLRRLS